MSSQPAHPSADEYATALLPFVRALETPAFLSDADTMDWLRRLRSHLIGRDTTGIATDCVRRLRLIADNEERWSLVVKLCYMLMYGATEEETLAKERQIAWPGISDLAVGLVVAVQGAHGESLVDRIRRMEGGV